MIVDKKFFKEVKPDLFLRTPSFLRDILFSGETYYLNPFMPAGNKSSYILKQTWNF